MVDFIIRTLKKCWRIQSRNNIIESRSLVKRYKKFMGDNIGLNDNSGNEGGNNGQL